MQVVGTEAPDAPGQRRPHPTPERVAQLQAELIRQVALDIAAGKYESAQEVFDVLNAAAMEPSGAAQPGQ